MGGEKSQIDLERLRYEIQHLNNRKDLYFILRDELIKKDWWKFKGRGNPRKGYKGMRTKKESK